MKSVVKQPRRIDRALNLQRVKSTVCVASRKTLSSPSIKPEMSAHYYTELARRY